MTACPLAYLARLHGRARAAESTRSAALAAGDHSAFVDAMVRVAEITCERANMLRAWGVPSHSPRAI